VFLDDSSQVPLESSELRCFRRPLPPPRLLPKLLPKSCENPSNSLTVLHTLSKPKADLSLSFLRRFQTPSQSLTILNETLQTPQNPPGLRAHAGSTPASGTRIIKDSGHVSGSCQCPAALTGERAGAMLRAAPCLSIEVPNAPQALSRQREGGEAGSWPRALAPRLWAQGISLATLGAVAKDRAFTLNAKAPPRSERHKCILRAALFSPSSSPAFLVYRQARASRSLERKEEQYKGIQAAQFQDRNFDVDIPQQE
jgi:hypothetical protein